MSASTSQAAVAKRSKRPLALSAFLVLLAAATTRGMAVAIFAPESFRAEFPGATPLLHAAYLLCGVAILVALAAVWAWRRWGIRLALATWAAIFALDLAAQAPVHHTAGAPLAAALLLLLAAPRRECFS